MSILGKIFGGIWNRAKGGPGGHGKSAQPAPSAPHPGPTTPAAPAPAPVPTPTAVQPSQVDAAQVLDQMNDERSQKLNWRTSIVDLMKLVGMESSLQERRELADELGYSGDKSDTAAMNIWLHKQVMQKLEANGGKLPADLAD